MTGAVSSRSSSQLICNLRSGQESRDAPKYDWTHSTNDIICARTASVAVLSDPATGHTDTVKAKRFPI